MELQVAERQVLGGTLEIQRPPLCPELRLWLLGTKVDLNARCAELMQLSQLPYWAFCWGSGQALARFVLDHPNLVRGSHVVDFGTGCGVVGIAAALAGARAVTAVDVDPQARRFAALNAELNGVSLRQSMTVPPSVDVLLTSDVLYDNPELPQQAREFGAERILLADPQRPGNPQLDQPPLARYQARTLPDVDHPVREALIYAL